MKIKYVTGIVAAICVFLTGATALAAGELDVDLMSSYVWRGQVVNKDMVLQPGFTLEMPVGLSLNAWANMDLTDKNGNRGEFTEVDLTAAYSIPLPEDSPVSVEIGVIEYLFPKEGEEAIMPPSDATHAGLTHSEIRTVDDDTREVYVSTTLNTILAPSLGVYYDFDEVSGWYVNLGIGHEIKLCEKLTAMAGASLGWGSDRYNNQYFGVDKACLNDMNLDIGLAYSITDEISMAAVGMYTFLPDSTLRDGADDTYGQKDRLYGGLQMAYGF